MQGRLTNKPVEEVIAAIQALDLESVKLRVMDPELGEGWSREYADSIEAAYKNYLTMLAKYQDDAEDIMLSKDVDEFWHTHILQTMKYADDCEKVFGNFLHHTPHIGERTEADLAKRAALADKTRRLYELEFGDSSGAAWYGHAPDTAAFSGATIKPTSAAFSGVAMKVDSAAFSGATIKPQNAAFSGVTINTSEAAFSGASIKVDRAAFSGATIRSENAAFSGATILRLASGQG